jgi:hypothetical protein
MALPCCLLRCCALARAGPPPRRLGLPGAACVLGGPQPSAAAELAGAPSGRLPRAAPIPRCFLNPLARQTPSAVWFSRSSWPASHCEVSFFLTVKSFREEVYFTAPSQRAPRIIVAYCSIRHRWQPASAGRHTAATHAPSARRGPAPSRAVPLSSRASWRRAVVTPWTRPSTPASSQAAPRSTSRSAARTAAQTSPAP